MVEFPFAPLRLPRFDPVVMDAIKILGPKTLVASPERQLEADSDMQIVHRVQAGDVAAFDRVREPVCRNEGVHPRKASGHATRNPALVCG